MIYYMKFQIINAFQVIIVLPHTQTPKQTQTHSQPIANVHTIITSSLVGPYDDVAGVGV